MLKVEMEDLDRFETKYPGIKEQILHFENAQLPACPHCGSMDTANVQVGVIGRTMHIAVATTKFQLLMNGPKPGPYRCHACNKFFGQDLSKVEKPNTPGGFTSRPGDKSLAAYKQWVIEACRAVGAVGPEPTAEEWRESWKEFWSN